jgi:hypothetical protein
MIEILLTLKDLFLNIITLGAWNRLQEQSCGVVQSRIGKRQFEVGVRQDE